MQRSASDIQGVRMRTMFESPSNQLMNQHMREGCHSRQAEASFCVEVLSR